MELITVVVPVFNTAPYLHQCLESILTQSWPQLEVILVDDGSTDGSVEICRHAADRDPRVRVLQQAHAGVAAARNLGVASARGSLVMFVDSDDWIDPDTCESLAEVLDRPDIDLALLGYTREYATRSSPRRLFPRDGSWMGEAPVRTLQRRIIGQIDAELREPEAADSVGVVFGRLYRTSIIVDHGLHFVDLAEIGSYEDGLFNLSYLDHARGAIYLDRCSYHHRKTNPSSVTTRYRPELAAQWDRLFDRMSLMLESRSDDPAARHALDSRIALSLIGLGLNECSPGNPRPWWRRSAAIGRIIGAPHYRAAVATLPLRRLPVAWRPLFLTARLRLAPLVHLQLAAMRRLLARRRAG